MRKLLLFIAVLSTFGAFAQTQILAPMPPQTGTNSPNVRGYYFVAPSCFTITGVEVPNTASSGNQSIAIVRLPAAPPAFSTTTNIFTTLFITQNDPTPGIIPVNIQVEQGDIIGVLGYRGTVNSYGNGTVGTTIEGFPVTLSRMGMQYPLTTVTPQELWSEPASTNISRVNLYYDSLITFSASHLVLNQSDVSFANNADTSFTSVWDYGDGSPLDTIDGLTVHTYAVAGNYTACNYITTTCGTDTICMSFTVCGSLVTSAAYSATTMGAMAMFTDASVNATTWLWDFGDSNTSTSQNPTHTYATSGTYYVCQTAYNSNCDTAMFCDSLTVCITPTVSFTYTNMGAMYMFDATTTEATAWAWDFGDGSPIVTSQDPTYTYSVSGTYTVCATAYGCDSLQFCEVITVCVPANAMYTSSDSAGTVMFMDGSTSADTWAWDFGDGSPVDINQNPTHTYVLNGTYNVCLIASSACSADTICTPVTVCPETLTAVFSSSDSATTAMFMDMSSTATSWLWDFGDGNFSTSQNPTHTYANTGLYTVCLTTWNICGDSMTSCDTVLLVITGQEALNANVQVGVYPNPMNDATTITVNSSEHNGNYVFEMYDAAGKLVRTQNGVFNQAMNVSRGGLANGMYVYKIRVSDVTITNGNIIITE